MEDLILKFSREQSTAKKLQIARELVTEYSKQLGHATKSNYERYISYFSTNCNGR